MTDLSPETVGKRLYREAIEETDGCRTWEEALIRAVRQGRSDAIKEAVTAARDALVNHEWPPQDGDKQCDEVLDAIRALAAGDRS